MYNSVSIDEQVHKINKTQYCVFDIEISIMIYYGLSKIRALIELMRYIQVEVVLLLVVSGHTQNQRHGISRE